MKLENPWPIVDRKDYKPYKPKTTFAEFLGAVAFSLFMLILGYAFARLFLTGMGLI